MRVGLMRTPITFETYTETRDSLGQPVKDWQFYLKAFAKPVHEQQMRFWSAAQVQAEGKMVWETRYSSGLFDKLKADVEAVRIKEGSRIFEIEGYIDPDERKKRLHLLVKEVL